MDPCCRASTSDHSRHQLFWTFLQDFWWTWDVADRDPTPKQDSSAEFRLAREYAMVVCTSVCHQIWVTNIMDPSCRASTPDRYQPQLFLDFFFKIFGESDMSPNRVWGSWVSCQTLWIQVVEHRPLIILSPNCFWTFVQDFWWIEHIAESSLRELSFMSNIMGPSCRASTPDHSEHQLFLDFCSRFLVNLTLVIDRDPNRAASDASASVFRLPFMNLILLIPPCYVS